MKRNSTPRSSLMMQHIVFWLEDRSTLTKDFKKLYPTAEQRWKIIEILAENYLEANRKNYFKD
jgi:hypothetical protein